MSVEHCFFKTIKKALVLYSKMSMLSNSAIIKKCVVQRFGVRTPEWTLLVSKSPQDDPKMVPSLQKLTPRWLPDSKISQVFSDFAN